MSSLNNSAQYQSRLVRRLQLLLLFYVALCVLELELSPHVQFLLGALIAWRVQVPLNDVLPPCDAPIVPQFHSGVFLLLELTAHRAALDLTLLHLARLRSHLIYFPTPPKLFRRLDELVLFLLETFQVFVFQLLRYVFAHPKHPAFQLLLKVPRQTHARAQVLLQLFRLLGYVLLEHFVI